MNNLPDDLRALEARLGQLKPRHEIDLEQLAFQAGLACANSKHEVESPVRLFRYCTITALISVAATVVALLILSSAPAPERLANNRDVKSAENTPIDPAGAIVHELPEVQISDLTLTRKLLGTHWSNHWDNDGLSTKQNNKTSDHERSSSGERSPTPGHLDWRRTIIEELGLLQESV